MPGDSLQTWPPVSDVLARILEIVGVRDAERRQAMINEVEHLAKMRAEQVVWEGLPSKARDQIRALQGEEKRALIKQYVQRSAFELALLQATEELVPDYVTTMTKVATAEQKQEIEALLHTLEQ